MVDDACRDVDGDGHGGEDDDAHDDEDFLVNGEYASYSSIF